MKRKRVLVGVGVVGATIYVSLYGGTISYLLFFSMWLVIVMAVCYMGYVYYTFKVFQKVETRALVKGQEVPYYFNLSNESKIAFTSVSVSFMEGLQQVKGVEEVRGYCLLPGESIRKQTTIQAKYRGEYEIGIDCVSITDLFGIGTVTYRCKSKIQAKVLPRIIRLESFCFYSEEEDEKQDRSLPSYGKEALGKETREYRMGDDKKQIHWKLSACKETWMVREYTKPQQVEWSVVIDLHCKEKDALAKLRLEDKVMEAAIAVVHYLFLRGVRIRVFYEQDGIHLLEVHNRQEFEQFYEWAAEVPFSSETRTEEIFSGVGMLGQEEKRYLVVTGSRTPKLISACYGAIASGNELNMIQILQREEGGESVDGIEVVTIEIEGEIEEKLTRKG